jgi:hypothetical protein
VVWHYPILPDAPGFQAGAAPAGHQAYMCTFPVRVSQRARR